MTRNPVLSRRALLAAGAGLAFLNACGGQSSGSGGTAGGSPGSGRYGALINRFQNGTLATGRQRLPMVLGDTEGIATGGPETLTGVVVGREGRPIGTPISAARHDEGVPTAYWPFLLALDEPGVYELAVEVDGTRLTSAFSVEAPGDILLPQVGGHLPPFETPTVGDGRGVDPICTRQPACPLHDMTLTEALASGRPVAYLIGTPAFCQTASCGPGLEFLLAERDRFGNAVAMVHAEVYTNTSLEQTAPAVDGYSMTFEPSLFVADASGRIVERLDSVWDAAELRDALALVAP